MRFFRKTPGDVQYNDAELKEANILEAYTCWLKNEKLTRKQKRLLKEIPESPRFHALKELVDFAHYRFQETESVKPRPGAKERAAERLMKTIKGEITKPEPEVLVDLVPEPAYSPQAMGNLGTDVFPGTLDPPTDAQLKRWGTQEAARQAQVRTLAHLNLQFERQDDEMAVTDLGSTMPTHVEGVRLKKSAPIQKGTAFKCGDITFQIVDIEDS